MRQQINLYDPALLRKQELLTALNLAVMSGALLLVLGAWGGIARFQLAKLENESRGLAPVVSGLQGQMVAIGKQIAEAKPDPRLEAELAAAREQLRVRGDALAALNKGVGGDSPSFAEYLRGFARQAPPGLWLTGFRISDGGASMEIHGRMTNPALLPEYIARLNNEKAFRGVGFAALKIEAGKPESTGASAATTSASAPGSSGAAVPYLEFTLIPESGLAAEGSTGGDARPAAAPRTGETPKAPETLKDMLPPELARELGGKLERKLGGKQ